MSFSVPGLPIWRAGENLQAMKLRANVEGSLLRVAFLVPAVGTVIRKDASADAEAMLSCLALVTSRLPLSAEIIYLTRENEQPVLN